VPSSLVGTESFDSTSTRVVVELDQWVAMRDGTKLATDIYRPDDNRRHAVLVHRSPYAKANPAAVLDLLVAVRHGFVVVMQETRGCRASEGNFTPFHHEAQDGYDTIEWAAVQSWSTGAVGAFGASGNGATAVQAAIAAPPHLRCLAAVHTGFNPYEGWVYANGALELAFLHGWVRRFAGTVLARADVDEDTRLRLADALEAWSDQPAEVIRRLPLASAFPQELSPFFFEWLAHPVYDDYWAAVDAVAQADQLKVPVLHLTGWYDGFLLGHMEFQRALQRHPDPLVRTESRLVVGPWDHHAYLSPTKSSWSGERDFGGAALSGEGLTGPLLLAWFQRWLQDADTDTGVPVRYFVMGAQRGWRDVAQWPPATEDLELHLDSGVEASGIGGDGVLAREMATHRPDDTYRYDPANPTPTTGGRHLGLEFAPSGVWDQSTVEERDDVLVFVGSELTDAVEVAGRVRVRLFASSTARDTDFCAKVVDVEPSGYRAVVAEGTVRARYRAGRERVLFLEPEEVVEYDIDCWDTAYTFGAGHRIALEIASANFPRHDRNLNVARPIAEIGLDEAEVALQTVHHDRARPSRLVLPVVARMQGTPP
jgi:putative CocE/NonD family hydrolase